MWKNSGVDINKHLSFYCGGGYRDAAVMWYAQAMGVENTSLYNDNDEYKSFLHCKKSPDLA